MTARWLKDSFYRMITENADCRTIQNFRNVGCQKRNTHWKKQGKRIEKRFAKNPAVRGLKELSRIGRIG